MADWPGFLRDISSWIAAKSNAIPEGHPSMIPPNDSPKVVNLNSTVAISCHYKNFGQIYVLWLKVKKFKM
jgi:hypothetical protein